MPASAAERGSRPQPETDGAPLFTVLGPAGEYDIAPAGAADLVLTFLVQSPQLG